MRRNPTHYPDLARPVKRFARNLTVQVLFAVACGVLLGVLDPAPAKQMKPHADTCASWVTMWIVPVIFLTPVRGRGNRPAVRKRRHAGGGNPERGSCPSPGCPELSTSVSIRIACGCDSPSRTSMGRVTSASAFDRTKLAGAVDRALEPPADAHAVTAKRKKTLRI